MNRTDITQSISRALHSLAMPIETRLYGNEARADSDIDLLILVDQWRTIAKEWLDVVEKHYGVKAIIYTNLNGYGDWIKDDKMLCDHDASSRQHEESFFYKV